MKNPKSAISRAVANTHVVVDETMSWPQAGERLDDIDWKLRYAPQKMTRKDELMAASIISAYQALVHKSAQEFPRIASAIREHTVYGEE